MKEIFSIGIILFLTCCSHVTHESHYSNEELWLKAEKIKSIDQVIGSWVHKESGQSKAAIYFSFGENSYGTYSIVTKQGLSTGSPIQYKVAESILYWRSVINEPIEVGEWANTIELRYVKNSLLLKSNSGITTYASLQNR